MKVRNHLFHTGNASRHGINHVELIAVVDTHVRIGRPNQHRVNSSVSGLQIVEISIHRVLPGDRVIEIAVLHHHLRLNEAALSPLQGRNLVARAVVSDPDSSFCAPMGNVTQPCFVISAGALAILRVPRIVR